MCFLQQLQTWLCFRARNSLRPTVSMRLWDPHSALTHAFVLVLPLCLAVSLRVLLRLSWRSSSQGFSHFFIVLRKLTTDDSFLPQHLMYEDHKH